ncbi:MAG: amidohydrolase [Gammaproteobacteria bacterium]|nr:MAG: amidohydrolase [Gammaproteobacteria bacterium]
MIDAHQHFWRIGEHDCSWPTPDLMAIYRDFLPDDLLPLVEQTGVTGTVLVQSQPSDADTDFLLQLAHKSDLIKAVVGWVDLSSPSAPERILQLAQHPKFRGVRPMLQGLADDAWILRPELEPAITAIKASNLSFDALVHVRHLPHLQVFAERHPDLAIVIDHAAKPAVANDEFSAWATAITALADLPRVYCKLSGLLTEASSEQGVAVLQPYVMQLYRLFGSKRLMWGSDWPVLSSAPNSQYNAYASWLKLAKELLSPVSITETDEIFGLTARQFYRF